MRTTTESLTSPSTGPITSERGAEGAELVIEIRSPGDESLVKIPWYLAHGCREVVIIDRDALAVELHGPGGRMEPTHSDVLGCTFRTVAGPAVEVSWEVGTAIVRHH